MSDERTSEKIVSLMEDHVRNNEMKLLRLHMGMERVVETSERTEDKLNEMVDDVATLRTRVAHLRDDVEELKTERIGHGQIYRAAAVVVGAAITIATFVNQMLKG